MSNARNSTSAWKSPTHKQDTYERGPRYFEYTQGHIINAMDHIDIQQENINSARDNSERGLGTACTILVLIGNQFIRQLEFRFKTCLN